MKKFLLVAASTALAISALAGAALDSVGMVDQGWRLVRGFTNVGPIHSTRAACTIALLADVATRKESASYRCENKWAATGVYTEDPIPDPDPTPDPTPTPTPGTWAQVAVEEQIFTLTEQTEVRYGFGDQWVQRSLTGTVYCTSNFFGEDPAFGEYKVCQTLTPTVVTPPVSTSMMPYVNPSMIPAGSGGSGDVLARATTEQPGPSDGTGAFRTVCDFSHMNFDDPLVYPGQQGKSHLHAFFGNTAANFASTVTSIANGGNSTCRGGILNRSAYWVPAMVDTLDGRPITPRTSNIYYKTGYWGVVPSTVQAMPQGLRIIAGDMKNDGPGEPYANMPFGYSCISATDSYGHGLSIPLCNAGDELQQDVFFPQCWDGVNLDSPDHKSHMAYPDNGCPASHPVPLLEISYHVLYAVGPSDVTSRWRLSSDNYATDKPGGYSGHGDWMNGWQISAMDALTNGCNKPAKDCHSHLLGDGREIY